MSQSPVILWFRRDLRLSDNTALNAAVRSGSPVIPLFIFDPAILKGERTGAPRVAFLLKALASLDHSLRERGASLVLRQGSPAELLPRLIEESAATALYFNRDTSPYALRRDAAVEQAVTVPIHRFDDSLLVAPGDVLKADSTPYTVFTPFKKTWLTIPKALPETVAAGSSQWVSMPSPDLERFSLAALGFGATIDVPEASEAEARQRLEDFVSDAIYAYAFGRNRLAAGLEDSAPRTSCLSAYLHLGLLSIREAYHAADTAQQNALDDTSRHSVAAWVSELAWREFYQHILFHFPQVVSGNFRSEYDVLPWRDAPEELQAWKAGQTGYPIVDAAMRQLRHTGWMPNRARMIVASFLSKHLLINWREGELHFMQWLIDGDLASNNGGWQWAAGTGTDAQPYFRIFNPILQSRRYDPDGDYLRHWIPELSAVDSRLIHSPWDLPQPPVAYPLPIVDHAFARQRALQAFAQVKQHP